MDTKFLSYTGLQKYDDLIKAYVDTGLSGKSGSTHTHDDRYYTETEIDEKINSIPNYVVRNIEDVTRIAEKSTMVGFYFYLNDPIPNGLYYYDRSKYNGRILYAVIVNKEGTAVEKQFPVYHPILLAISSDEESVDIISISDVSTTEAYYDIVNKTYTLTEKTYSAIQIDTKISDLNTSITEQLALKAESNHIHDDRYYTETEIDSKLSDVNTSIGNITSGSTPVKEAEHATNADTATNATSATYASTATKAETAANATSATYATTATSAGTASKLGTATVGSATKPIYLNAGVATTCTTYAGGTKITLNGTNKGGSTAAIFAPTTGGTSGYILKSAGTASAPVWSEFNAYTKTETDTKVSNATKGMATTAVVDSKIKAHNESTTAHSDIRTTLAEVKADVDAFFKDADMATTAKETLKDIQDYITTHTSEAADMVSAIEGKAEKSDLTAHAESTVSHITAAERTAWNAKASTDAATTTTAGLVKLTNSTTSTSTTTAATPNSVRTVYAATTAVQTSLDTHTASTVPHVSTTERTNWNAAYNHSTVAHAPSNAEKNQNAFSKIAVNGSTMTVDADTVTDTVTFAGSNVTITPDATNDKITFTVADGTTSTKGIVKLENSVTSASTVTAATPKSVKQAYDLATSAKNAATAVQTNLDTHNASTVHITAAERTAWNAKASTANATTKTAGLMSSADKTKLDGIATGANKYTHPTTSGNKHIPSGGSAGLFLKWDADGTAVWATDNNTTYSNATSSTAGLVKSGSTVTNASGYTAVPIIDGIPYYKDTNTKYAAGTGISLSGTTFSNSGVRSVVTGTTNGTIIVNTNGATASVPVKGLGTSAFENSTTAVTSGSTDLVTSGAVYKVIDTATSAITANTNSISTLTSAIESIEEISLDEISALFS